MNGIQKLFMIGIAAAAVVTDLKTGKIPNWLILIGLALGMICQVMEKGIIGFLLFAGGTGVPVLLFGLLYYFRMIGAGDIKLLCAMGGFTGPAGSLYCIFLTVLWGGFISLGIMLYRRNLVQRMEVFFRYISQYGSGCRGAYMSYAPREAKFCFSIPVLLGILCFAGGIF